MHIEEIEKDPFDTCQSEAFSLYDIAKNSGLDPILLQMVNFKGDVTKADKRWQKLPPSVWSHYIILIHGIVFDPTAKQFDKTCPKRYSVDKLKELWGEAYKITP